MLSKIRIQNFKSIDDLTIDFSHKEGKAPNGYAEIPELYFLEPVPNCKLTDRKIPVLAIYGANGSGKSNIVDSLFNYYQIIAMGLNPENYKPNKLKNEKSDTIMECEFFIGNKRMRYMLGYNAFSITKEKFISDNTILFELNNQMLTVDKSLETDDYKSKKFQDMYKIRCLKSENNMSLQLNTFLRAIVDDFPGLNENLTQAVNYFASKITIGKRNYMSPMESVELLSNFTQNEDLQECFDKILVIMKKLNIDIEKIEYDKKVYSRDIKPNINIFSDTDVQFRPQGMVSTSITSYHKNQNGELIQFNFKKDESDGTQTAFGLIGPILKTLNVGGVLVVDEIDSSLHPLILIPLIKMFMNKEINKNNAQLIFTSHTTEILEDKDFRISEFLFINKSLKNGTFGKRLVELEDAKKLRNDINFRKRYLKGYYLGIPYPTM